MLESKVVKIKILTIGILVAAFFPQSGMAEETIGEMLKKMRKNGNGINQSVMLKESSAIPTFSTPAIHQHDHVNFESIRP